MKKVIIFLGLAVLCVMSIAIADIVIKNFIPSAFSEPCLSFTFDDGYKSHYSVVNPLLQEKNFNATFFVFPRQYNSGIARSYMGIPEIKTLIKNGYEIGSHTLTHPNVKNLFREQLAKELAYAKIQMEKDFDIEISSFAHPFFASSKQSIEVGKRYYKVVRSIYPKSFFIQTYAPKKTSDYDEICDVITRAKKRDLWLILVFHSITDSPGEWDTYEKDFIKLLECTKESAIPVRSLDGCKSRLFGKIIK